MEYKAWCVRCKTKTDVKDPKEVEYNLGVRGKRRAVRGTCSVCDTKVSAILKSK
ncbi:hypothetical protein LCGC14_1005710 [marine sediment metagenome]|uniref:DUF5679 domain-containing protein n=1 Tax=marine sediment metagenome TaxID=412755 RepID=A0A0F9N1V7_9ZZZZ